MRLKTFQEREYCGEREKSFLGRLPVRLKWRMTGFFQVTT
jgi:hypothetical protein